MRGRNRGSMIGAVLILLAFVGLVMFLVGALATVGALNGRSMEERGWETGVIAWNTVVAGDALAELQANTFLQNTTVSQQRRGARITSILQPTSSGTQAGIVATNLSFTAPTLDPWNKANALTISPPLGLLHPCGRSHSLTFLQNVSATLQPDGFVGSRAAATAITYHTFCSTDVGLLLTDPYTGLTGPAVAVHGTAFLAGGFTASTGTTRLSADVLAAPSGVLASGAVGKMLSGTTVAIHPFYRASLGTAPTELCRAANQTGSMTSQSFFDRSTVVVHVIGMASTSLPAGVTIQEYPVGGGVKRVVVDLAILAATSTKLYVNLVQATDKSAGVAVLGSASAPAGQSAVVATNGLVRLEGNNAMPCVVASGYGQVFCEDLTANAGLMQTWVGALYFPGATTFSTTQAGSGAVLRVQGAMFTGSLAGNLPLIDITETRSTRIRDLGPRFVTVGAVR